MTNMMRTQIRSKSIQKYVVAFYKLSWIILQHKFIYYYGVEHGIKPVKDSEYDKLEIIYKKLAKKLKLPPSATNMVGFDINRPCCKMVSDQMLASKGKSNIKIKIKDMVYS